MKTYCSMVLFRWLACLHYNAKEMWGIPVKPQCGVLCLSQFAGSRSFFSRKSQSETTTAVIRRIFLRLIFEKTAISIGVVESCGIVSRKNFKMEQFWKSNTPIEITHRIVFEAIPRTRS